MFLKTYNTDFHEVIIKFTDQKGRLLEIEGKVSLTLFIIIRNDAMFYRTQNEKIC